MARTPSLGVIKLHWTPTVVSLAAPTVAEAQTNAVDLTGYMLRDGLDTPQKGKTIPAASVKDLYDTTLPGSFGGDPIMVKLFRDTVLGTDTAWSTLPPRTGGFLIIARFGGSGAPASAQLNLNALAHNDRVEVWPISVISRENDKISDTTPETFVVHAAVPTAPNLDAVVN